jgi:hypothetical protein
MDTPGLADILRKEIAAMQLEQALHQPGKAFKINFVIQLRSGRVPPEDLQTISKVRKLFTFCRGLRERADCLVCAVSMFLTGSLRGKRKQIAD